MIKKIFYIFKKKETDHEFCMKCRHFSLNTSGFVYKKKLKFFHIKYWKFLYSKIAFWKQGRCGITLMLQDGNHINLKMRGYEQCLINDVQNNIEGIQKS